jgi:hypothetical protein
VVAISIKCTTLLAGFGHFAVAVPDVYKAVDDIKASGEAAFPRLKHRPERIQQQECLAGGPCVNMWTSARTAATVMQAAP